MRSWISLFFGFFPRDFPFKARSAYSARSNQSAAERTLSCSATRTTTVMRCRCTCYDVTPVLSEWRTLNSGSIFEQRTFHKITACPMKTCLSRLVHQRSRQETFDIRIVVTFSRFQSLFQRLTIAKASANFLSHLKESRGS